MILICTLLVLAPPAMAQTSAPHPRSAPQGREDRRAPTSQPTGKRFHLLFTSDIYGRYAWPGCGVRKPDRADLSQLVTVVKRRRDEIRRDGEGEPVVVAGGSMLRPDVMGNHIFGEGRAWAGAATELLKRVGFDAVSVGPYDFGAHPDVLETYMKRMAEARLPLLAANVRCKKAGDFRCKYLKDGGKPYLVLQRGELRVGLFAVVRQDLVARILGRSAGSMETLDPVKEARRLIQLLRKQEKVDLVVVLATLNLESNAPEPVLTFVRQLQRDAPDLVVSDNMFYRKSSDFITRIENRVGPVIVGTDRFGQHLGDAIVEYDKDASGTTIQRVRVEMQPVAAMPPDRRADRLVGDLRSELCRALNQPLGRARFTAAMTQDDFIQYLMEVMRNRMGAEIALLNDSAVADTSFPMAGKLTREKVLRAIRTETHLGTFRMTGARLKKVLLPYLSGTSTDLKILGLVKDGLKYYVNSRPLVDGQHYKVAVTKFVASGGDGLISLLTERFADSGFALRRAATDFFEGDRQALLDGDPSINLKTDFPDPWDKWVIYGETNIGLSMSDVSIDNYDAHKGATRYNQPLLTRDDVASLKLDIGVGLGASNRNHTLEVDLALQYGKTWTLTAKEEAEGKDSTEAETLDKIRADLLYRLNMIRNRRAPGRWYLPVPYAEATLITEFTPSATYCVEKCGGGTTDDVLGEYRYLELGGTVGIGFLLHPYMFAKAGFAVSGELLTPQVALDQVGQERAARTGFYLGYKLRRVKLISSVHHPLQLESRLDFFMTDLGESIRRELTVQTKVYFSLTPILHVSAGHSFYVFDTRGRDASWANDISLGLDLLLDYRHQLF